MHDAAYEWARPILAAPRRFPDLIRSVEVGDVMIERVATRIVRRDLREERIPSGARKVVPPKLDERSVDPFAVSREALRDLSEHVEHCPSCDGGGLGSCSACAGGGRLTCPSCQGTRKQRSAKTNRPINCKMCKATGTIACSQCGGDGNVPCATCSGSGHQAVWLTYDEDLRWEVALAPETDVERVHPQLREPRALASTDCSAFDVQARDDRAAAGALRLDRPIVAGVVGAVDPRLERVVEQQYLRLAVVRRVASYEMCGTVGRIALSGRDLWGAQSPEALGPIRWRAGLWGGAVAGLAGLAVALAAALRGKAVYFDASNRLLATLAGAALVLAVPAIGGFLRALRPGPRLGRIARPELAAGVACLVMFAAMPAVWATLRPGAAKVTSALAVGDVEGARRILAGWEEAVGRTVAVDAAEDEIRMAEAAEVGGEERAALLAAVAGGSGLRAPEARALLRTDRLAEVRRLNGAHSPDEALERLIKWFPVWRGDPEVAGERARAFEERAARCADGVCRAAADHEASEAAPTAARTERAAASRRALLDALGLRDVPEEALAARLERLRTVAETATKASETIHDDDAIAGAAAAASAWARAERAATPILGNDPAIAAELLGAPVQTEGPLTWIDVDAIRVYLTLDARRKARGVYAVGRERGARALLGPAWPAERLLSQTLGHAADLVRPRPGVTSSRFKDGAISVVARWKGGDLIELRIGDATP